MESSVNAQAVCAFHPGAAATGTCSRCGSFICAQCTEHGGQPTCAACRARTEPGAFPLSRGDWDTRRLFTASWAAFAANWLPLSGAMAAIIGISWGLAFLGEIAQEGSAPLAKLVEVAGWVIQAPLVLGFIRMAHVCLNGGHARIGELFSQYRKLPALLGLLIVTSLLVMVLIGIPLVCVIAVLPGSMGFSRVFVAVGVLLVLAVILVVPYYFAQVELALNDKCGPIQALKSAFGVCSGQWLAAIGEFLLIGLAALASLLALLVGFVPGAAFAMVAVVALYLTLRNGSGLERL